MGRWLGHQNTPEQMEPAEIVSPGGNYVARITATPYSATVLITTVKTGRTTKTLFRSGLSSARGSADRYVKSRLKYLEELREEVLADSAREMKSGE